MFTEHLQNSVTNPMTDLSKYLSMILTNAFKEFAAFFMGTSQERNKKTKTPDFLLVD